MPTAGADEAEDRGPSDSVPGVLKLAPPVDLFCLSSWSKDGGMAGVGSTDMCTGSLRGCLVPRSLTAISSTSL